jgi:hypothetical protein
MRFAHYGFRDGEKWNESYQWFARALKGVLGELAKYCTKQRSLTSAGMVSIRSITLNRT